MYVTLEAEKNCTILLDLSQNQLIEDQQKIVEETKDKKEDGEEAGPSVRDILNLPNVKSPERMQKIHQKIDYMVEKPKDAGLPFVKQMEELRSVRENQSRLQEKPPSIIKFNLQAA